ncbi:MAG: hypothetical protein JNK04_17040, partial [Myxococcales bacterium]|nr:hypothetical protein [Myxococcales bacterium]
MTDGFDRGAILARRALMISSALASLHCSNTPPATDGPVETVTLPTTEPMPSGSTVASANPPSTVPALPSWQAELKKAPSRNVDQSLPESIKESLTSMNAM